MAFAHRGDTAIYYETRGHGFPVIAIAPGGLRSAIDFWDKVQWNLPEIFADDFRLIMLDLRTAGRSTTTIKPTDGWKELEEDIISVLDDLDVKQAHCMGMCIGGAFVVGLLEHYPTRFIAGVPIQPIGLDNNIATFEKGFEEWKTEYLQAHPTADPVALQEFIHNILRSDFLFNDVTREEVAQLTNPLLILEGNDEYHPQAISQELARLAPHAELISDWKTDLTASQQRVKKFLQEHTRTY